MKLLVVIFILGAAILNGQEVKPAAINEQKAVTLIKELGAEHFRVRKKAKKSLEEMGFRIVPLLRKQLKEASDPEVSENLKEIIKKLTHRLHFEQLSDKEKTIAKLKFQTIPSEGEAQAKVYSKEKCMILDINRVRFVIDREVKGLKHGHNFEIDLKGNGGGGSSSTGDLEIYRYSYRKGVGEWAVCGESFKVVGGKIEIFGKTIDPALEHHQVIFIEKGGKVKGILDLK